MHMVAVLEKRKSETSVAKDKETIEHQLRNLTLFQDNPTGGCFVVAHNMLEAKMLQGYCTVLQKHYHELNALPSIIRELMHQNASIRNKYLKMAAELPLPESPEPPEDALSSPPLPESPEPSLASEAASPLPSES